MYKRLLIKVFEVAAPNGTSPGYLSFGDPYTGNLAVVADILCENAAAWIFLGPVSHLSLLFDLVGKVISWDRFSSRHSSFSLEEQGDTEVQITQNN